MVSRLECRHQSDLTGSRRGAQAIPSENGRPSPSSAHRRNELYAGVKSGQFCAKLNTMSRFSIIKEFLEFLRERKKWWIAPIVIFLLVLGGLLIFAKGSALAPFIYSLF